MAFLSVLPEIQTQIISEVSSVRDLAALSQSCRSLHLLYDMNTRERFYQIRVYPDESSINRTFLFILEILRRPNLGNYLQKIEQYWRPILEAPYIEIEGERELSAGIMDLLHAAVKKAGFVGSQERAVLNMVMQNETRVLREHLPAYGEGYDLGHFHGTFIAQALTAIFISISPNLVSLAITQPFVTYYQDYWDTEKCQSSRESHIDYPLDQFLRRANANSANNIGYLQNLRNVYMIVDEAGFPDDDRFYIPIDFMGCTKLFDRLPSIESISTDALCEDENNSSRLVPRSSNISRIHLNHCALGTPYLAYLIQSCRELREFQYIIGGRGVLGGSSVCFNVKTFIKSILPHNGTLEVLDIDAETNMCHFGYCNQEGRIEEEIDGRAADLHNNEYIRTESRVDWEINELGVNSDIDGDTDEEQQFLRSFWGNSGSQRIPRVEATEYRDMVFDLFRNGRRGD